MIELHVMGIALDTRTGTPIVVLNDADNRRALPIWIGTAEASAIIRQLESIESVRPMTHDLLHQTIMQLGYTVRHIEINDITEETYFASIVVAPASAKPADTEANVSLDARPSDAIAVALRAQVPIFATTTVVADGMIATEPDREEAEAKEFSQFVSGLNASDFKFDRDIESNS